MHLRSFILSLVLAALMVLTVHAQDHIFFDGGPFYNEVLFEESFTKGQGPFAATRTITVGPDLQSTVRIFLRNGDPVLMTKVNNGAITLNGRVIFGMNDFRVEGEDLWAVVTKEVDLLAGDNTLDVELKGGGTGTIHILILRPTAFQADAVYVAPPDAGGVDNSQCGPLSSPCATIGYGIAQAGNLLCTKVLVANGVYVENIELVPGIDLLGGFSSDFSTRDVQGTATVVHGGGSALPTISADDIASATLFEGFIVQGPFVTAAAGNSIAVLTRNSTNALEIRNNVILAGVAGNGVEGLNGANGQDGPDGSPGSSAVTGNNTLLGGSGGVMTDFGTKIDGGSGGNSSPPVSGTANGDGSNGESSLGGAGGSGGINGEFVEYEVPRPYPLPPLRYCVFDISGGDPDASNGHNGGAGSNGSSGLGGTASSSGVDGSGNWHTASGSVGADGTPGSGGGGGGAGGGGENEDASSCPDDVTGPSGGGGGAGGVSGKRGYGGSGGGATFGIFVFTAAVSPPIIEDNLIFLGRAGDGGDGGSGGLGGLGGQGGSGGQCDPLFGCGNAGDGGNGGGGGHGGGGGGGAGGDSVGIFSNFNGGYDLLNTVDISTGVAGAGGKGGQSHGNKGQNGEPGGVFDILESL